jgi:hypothetical protein
MNFIEINDSTDKNFLSVSLYDLLIILKNEIKKYNWSIYELTAVGNQNSDINVPELEDKILRLSTGLHVDGKELIKLAKNMDQIINLILVASLHTSDFFDLGSSKEWKSRYPLVIEIIDGYSWHVYAQDKGIINLLASTYKDTKVHYDCGSENNL